MAKIRVTGEGQDEAEIVRVGDDQDAFKVMCSRGMWCDLILGELDGERRTMADAVEAAEQHVDRHDAAAVT